MGLFSKPAVGESTLDEAQVSDRVETAHRLFAEYTERTFPTSAYEEEAYDWLLGALAIRLPALETAKSLEGLALFRSHRESVGMNEAERLLSRNAAWATILTAPVRRAFAIKAFAELQESLAACYLELLREAWKHAFIDVLKERPRLSKQISDALLKELGLTKA